MPFEKNETRRFGIETAALKGKNPGSDPLSLLLPSASQRLIKLHERQPLVELGLHQVQFR